LKDTNSIHQRVIRKYVSLRKALSAYLENERTREVSQAENNETAMLLFLLIIVWLIALACNHASRLEFRGR